MTKTYFVYILTNKRNGTLYIGFTDDLERRVGEHKRKEVDSFSKKYHLDKLVYYEQFDSNSEAFLRERRMKKWKRDWKIQLIESMNPQWNDLAWDWE
ncbi:MAG: GIY-YIG nuclease family protein [Bacteroidales bacterium]|nr:GIY-YIG nuclease family protein [Bacteroidales bacterium]MBS3776077.1 GIY-YIG nuclease family protein [Bacteroidales bacterium]